MTSVTKRTIVDLSGLGLDKIEETKEEFRIGAMCTLRQLETDQGLDQYFGGVFKECTKYQSQDISAKKGMGVEDLMEKVLLEAEMLDLKANPNRNATGSIIESSLDKGRGYVATVLVSNGTLKVGDIVLAGTSYGRVKAMFNERNQRVKEAGPAEPALILGFICKTTQRTSFLSILAYSHCTCTIASTSTLD